MNFLGAVTQYDACQDQGCKPNQDNPSYFGWRQLWTLMNADTSTGGVLNWSTDISWDS